MDWFNNNEGLEEVLHDTFPDCNKEHGQHVPTAQARVSQVT